MQPNREVGGSIPHDALLLLCVLDVPPFARRRLRVQPRGLGRRLDRLCLGRLLLARAFCFFCSALVLPRQACAHRPLPARALAPPSRSARPRPPQPALQTQPPHSSWALAFSCESKIGPSPDPQKFGVFRWGPLGSGTGFVRYIGRRIFYVLHVEQKKVGIERRQWRMCVLGGAKSKKIAPAAQIRGGDAPPALLCVLSSAARCPVPSAVHLRIRNSYEHTAVRKNLTPLLGRS